MSIFKKIAILTSLICLGLGIGVALLVSRVTYSELDAELTARGKALATILAEANLRTIIDGDRIAAARSVRKITEDFADVAYVFIEDFEDRIFTHSFEGGFPANLHKAILPSKDAAGLGMVEYESTLGRIRHISFPLIEGAAGRVHIGLSFAVIDARLRTLQLQILALTLGIVVAAGAVAYFMTQRITGPLQSVVEMVTAYGRGKCVPDKTFEDTGGSEEIAAIRNSFTEMIDRRRNAETALRESEERYRGLVENMSDGLGMVDAKGVVTFVNDRLCEMLGYRREELIGQTLLERGLLDDANWTIFEQNLGRRQAGDENSYELTFTRKNGGKVTTLTSPTPIFDADGSFEGSFAIMTDITARKQAEEQSTRLGRMVEASVNEIYAFDADTFRFVMVNEGARENLGFTMAELENLTPLDIKPEYTEEAFAELVQPLHDGSENQILFETVHKRKDGSLYPVDIRLQLMADKTSPLFMAIVQDVTERQAAAEAVRDSEARLNAFFDSAPTGLAIWDRDLRYMKVNDPLARTNGFSSEDHVGKTFDDIVPEMADAVTPVFQQVLDSGEPLMNWEIAGPTPSDPERLGHWLTSIFPIPGADDQIAGVGAVVTEITAQKQAEETIRCLNEGLERRVAERTAELSQEVSERKRAEAELHKAQEELVRKEKLATLGQLTGSVSHELRNPLGTVRTSVALIENKVHGKGLNVEDAIARLNRNIDRCDKIIDEMLAFARGRKIACEQMPVCGWLRDLLDELDIPPGITVRRELPTDDPVIDVDPDRLRRAVINVYENACQSMATGALKTGAVKKDIENILTVRAQEKDGRFEVSFCDNGPGMAPDVLANVFEPLYSTKSFGVGLGLPIVKQIMEQHGGGVSVDSAESRGTEVALWVPLHQKNGGPL